MLEQRQKRIGLLLEMLLIYLSFYAVHTLADISIYAFPATVVTVFICTVALRHRIGSLFTAGAVMLTAVAAGWLTGYAVMMAAVVAALVSWRFFVYWQKEPASPAALLGIGLFSGSINYAFVPSFDVLAIMLVYIGAVVIFAYLRTVDHGLSAGKRGQLLPIIAVVSLLAAVTAVITYVFPLVLQTFQHLYSYTVSALLNLLYPAVELFEDVSFDREEQEAEEQETIERDSMDSEAVVLNPADPAGPELVAVLLVFIMLIIAAVLAFLIVRRFKTKKTSRAYAFRSEQVETENRFDNEPPFLSALTIKKPEHSIRRAWLSLENVCRQNGFGREQEETAEEWLERLPLNHDGKDALLNVYSQVRYGQTEPEPAEKQHYYREIKALKKEVKQSKDG